MDDELMIDDYQEEKKEGGARRFDLQERKHRLLLS